MAGKLDGKRIAILATHGFEQSELFDPKDALEDEAAEVDVVAPESGTIRGWDHTEWGDSVKVDATLDDADPNDYDALMLPGGVMNPDKLRMNDDATAFARSFFVDGKPVAAICHGPQLLIECDVVRGREMTSYPAIATDLKNAGAKWVDREVVEDDGLVTSRRPADLEAFNEKMIELFARVETTAG